MTDHKERKESTTYASHDSRQEFTESLKVQLDELYNSYKLNYWTQCFKIISFIYGSIRALLSNAEREEFEKLLDKTRLYSDKRTPRRSMIYEVNIQKMSYMLYDLAHAHKLLLPHFSSDDDEDVDIDNILREGGL